MVPELETARVTELHVRMDCNGCVNKIKRAVHGVEGVYDILVNLPEQKLTVVGRAEPEAIVKAIRKARKTATICTPTEEAGEKPPPPEEPPAAETVPTPDAEPPAEAPTAGPPAEQSDEPPPPAPEPAGESPPAAAAPEVKEAEECPMVHHYPRGYYGERSSNSNWERDEGPFYVVTHSYNTYRPSAAVLEYAYGCGVAQPPAENVVTMRYHGDYYYDQRGGNGGNGNVASMFSDENPNACRIV